MFTKRIKQRQLPNVAYIWDRPGESSAPTDEVVNQKNPETSTDKKPVDWKALNKKIEFSKSVEAADKNGSGLTLAQLDKEVVSYMDLGYLPKESSTNISSILNPKKISIGPILTESTLSATISESMPKISEYTIKPGDTLSQIAKESGMTIMELAALNNIADINKIKVGQVIKLRGEKIQVSEKVSNRQNVAKNKNITPVTNNEPTKSAVETPLEAPKINVQQLINAKESLTAIKPQETLLKNQKLLDEYKKSLATALIEVNKLPMFAPVGEPVGFREKTIKNYNDLQKKVTEYQGIVQSNQKDVAEAKKYDDSSINEKNRIFYASELQKALREYQSLPLNTPEKVNQEQKSKIVAKIGELRSQIATCDILIKNDQKIADIKADTAKDTRFLNQSGNFHSKLENDQKIVQIQQENATLLAQLEKSSITPTMLANLRNSRQANAAGPKTA